MAWILVVLVAILIVLLARSFVINALELKRDVDWRFDEFRSRLENEANSTLDGFLEATTRDETSN